MLLIAYLVSPFAFGREARAAGGMGIGAGLSLSNDLKSAGAGAEYVSGNYPGAVLMPINLWGSVGRPGIHYVPAQTDLVTLLSYAGGPAPDADLGEVTIKRRTGAQDEVLEIDAEKLLKRPETRSPVLQPNDVVVVPRESPLIGTNTLTVVGVVGSLLGIVLAGIAINSANKR
jgi:hypothetical protein